MEPPVWNEKLRGSCSATLDLEKGGLAGLGRIPDLANLKIVLVKSNSLGDCSVFQAMLFTDVYVCLFASSLKQQVKYGLKQTCAHRHVPEHGIVPREYLDA